MPTIISTFGAALALLGLGGYFGTNRASSTALIPTWFGLVLIALGLGARNKAARAYALPAAGVVNLLGIAGTVRSLPKLKRLLAGDEIERPAAVVAQAIMAVLCAVSVGLYARSLAAHYFGTSDNGVS